MEPTDLQKVVQDVVAVKIHNRSNIMCDTSTIYRQVPRRKWWYSGPYRNGSTRARLGRT